MHCDLDIQDLFCFLLREPSTLKNHEKKSFDRQQQTNVLVSHFDFVFVLFSEFTVTNMNGMSPQRVVEQRKGLQLTMNIKFHNYIFYYYYCDK